MQYAYSIRRLSRESPLISVASKSGIEPSDQGRKNAVAGVLAGALVLSISNSADWAIGCSPPIAVIRPHSFVKARRGREIVLARS